MPGSKVFDSWALLAWLLDQPAAAHIEALLLEAENAGELRIFMSWMNVGEVYYMAARKVGPAQAEEFLQRLPSLPIQLVLPEPDDFVAAARLKATRRLSYADAFAAALAHRERAALVTGDPELLALKDVVVIEWIGA